MNNIQTTLSSSSVAPILPKASASQESQQQPAGLLTTTNKLGLRVSAEAQYLFEIDKYLSALDKTAQDKALSYLSQSSDPLQQQASDYFKRAQETLDQALGKDRSALIDRTESEKLRKLLDVEFERNGSTEVAIIPMGVKVFRLDGNDNFYPVQLNSRNDALKHQLDALEKTAYSTLGNQDAANLIGSVRNALYASENILLSFDDVLHYNYTIEMARKAIDFIDAPENLSSALTSILNQGISYQNSKQSKFLDDTRKFLNDGRVGQAASEDVRLGTAAQLYNNQLQATLNATGLSVLDARGVITQLLTQHTDLIRFSPDKLEDAFIFYKQDFENFERALNKDFYRPSQSNEPNIDSTLIDTGRNYAMNVIEEINSYLSK
ncbi:hypothetical protein DWB84_14790 [Saccharophagus sp. K07]|jgi:hypothetical protein|uniref:hypothetical protein n=1 Tax=Saccharophagus sp. K07 TaxID=2283636 RepID=UPI001651DC42|nr:hypothetical protein [Saccharophagus sp. K07]MBC6906717.1 hypothetical protein [Saccharophagus sp. K07]